MKKKCAECNGTGKIGVYGNVSCYSCKGKGYIKPKSKWEKKFDKKFNGWNADTFPAIKRFIKRLLKQKWDKEFEDDLVNSNRYGLDLRDKDLLALVGKYLDKTFLNPSLPRYLKWVKVKIKCKDGCIQIERIGQ